MLAEVREWLHKAAEDVRTAEVSCAAQPPLHDAAAFHCQQAAEKALKGFLTLHARVFEKTHSIEKIGALALAADPTLRAAIDRATPLTEYAWKFRYPGTPGEPVVLRTTRVHPPLHRKAPQASPRLPWGRHRAADDPARRLVRNARARAQGAVRLCVSERSLLPVVVAAKDARTLVPRFRDALAELLARLGVSPAEIERERAEMAEARLGRTASRQVLGTMNDFLRMFSWRAPGRSLLDQSRQLAEAPCGPIVMRSPDDLTLEMLRQRH